MTVPVPHYYRIKQTLLAAIARGDYPAGHAAITERSICAQFHVSRITAVRALNELVQEGMLVRQRGRGTFVTEQAYASANSVAPSPADRPSIAVIFHHLYGQHVLAMLQGMQHACRAVGVHVLLFESQGSALIEAENIQRAREAQVQGVIVLPVDGYANLAQFQELQAAHVPYVLIDRYYPMLPSDRVVPDNFGIGYQLTSQLIGAGHRAIAFVAEEVGTTSVQDRQAGYRLALHEHAIPLVPELAFLHSYVAMPDIERRALLTSWMQASYRPTAFLAANSFVLLKIVTDMVEAGMQLTPDIALASMDNANIDDLLAQTALIAALPSYDMGTTAAQLLFERINGVDRSARHMVLAATIPERAALKFDLRLEAPASTLSL